MIIQNFVWALGKISFGFCDPFLQIISYQTFLCYEPQPHIFLRNELKKQTTMHSNPIKVEAFCYTTKKRVTLTNLIFPRAHTILTSFNQLLSTFLWKKIILMLRNMPKIWHTWIKKKDCLIRLLKISFSCWYQTAKNLIIIIYFCGKDLYIQTIINDGTFEMPSILVCPSIFEALHHIWW